MPEEALAVVEEFWEAWNSRDVERAAAVLHPAAELRPMRAQLEGRAYVGNDGLRQLVADVDEDWDGLRIVVERQQARGDQGAQSTRLQGRGRVSGIDL